MWTMKETSVKRSLLIVLLVCTLCGYTQSQVRDNVSAESSFRAFLLTWEKAQLSFINGDPTQWKQNASHRDDATILGGFGGHGEKGWDAVGKRYDWAASQYKGGGTTLKVEYLNVRVSGDLGFTVAIERQEGARVGEQQTPTRRALRATQVFRKEEGAWKLLHRHADPLTEKQAPSTERVANTTTTPSPQPTKYDSNNPATWPAELDAIVAAPQNHKVVLENERVRVLEVTVQPGEREPVHGHKWPSVMYVMAEDLIRDYDSEGKLLYDSRTDNARLKTPYTIWMAPQAPHSVENLSKTPLRLLRVELKQ